MRTKKMTTKQENDDDAEIRNVEESNVKKKSWMTRIWILLERQILNGNERLHSR
jgi:hypothetical protein